VSGCIGERWKLGENANSEILGRFFLVTMVRSLIVSSKIVNVDDAGAWKADEDIMGRVDDEAVVFEEFVVNDGI
jgi:hypothetical protein